MTEVVEVLLSEALSLSIHHFWFVERVVDNLESFPITLSLQDIVHLLLSSTVAFSHDPSVELSKPYLFEENLNIT